MQQVRLPGFHRHGFQVQRCSASVVTRLVQKKGGVPVKGTGRDRWNRTTDTGFKAPCLHRLAISLCFLFFTFGFQNNPGFFPIPPGWTWGRKRGCVIYTATLARSPACFSATPSPLVAQQVLGMDCQQPRNPPPLIACGQPSARGRDVLGVVLSMPDALENVTPKIVIETTLNSANFEHFG